MLDHNTQGLDNGQPSCDADNLLSVRSKIPHFDHDSLCEQRQEMFPPTMAGNILTHFDRLWNAPSMISHFQLPYLCMSMYWSCKLMYDAMTDIVPTFQEVPFRLKGPEVIWDEISVIEIILVQHTSME
jgi:hypothetical protein